MFTGIVEELGEVKSVSRRGMFTVLCVKAVIVREGVSKGDSICVNGACLTVTGMLRDSLSFDVMAETVALVGLDSLRPGSKVNLERSLRLGDRVSGHFVSGHVDCRGVIRKKGIRAGNLGFEIGVGEKYSRYLPHKGSVALDGISLTIADKRPDSFFVYVIPHTLASTTLQFKGPGERVNIEFDVLAKAAAAAAV